LFRAVAVSTRDFGEISRRERNSPQRIQRAQRKTERKNRAKEGWPDERAATG
jgi:hypothetical protein